MEILLIPLAKGSHLDSKSKDNVTIESVKYAFRNQFIPKPNLSCGIYHYRHQFGLLRLVRVGQFNTEIGSIDLSWNKSARIPSEGLRTWKLHCLLCEAQWSGLRDCRIRLLAFEMKYTKLITPRFSGSVIFGYSSYLETCAKKGLVNTAARRTRTFSAVCTLTHHVRRGKITDSSQPPHK